MENKDKRKKRRERDWLIADSILACVTLIFVVVVFLVIANLIASIA